MRTLIGVDDPLTVRERRLLRLRHTFSGASVTPSDLGPSFTTVSGTPVVSGGVLSKAGASNLILAAPINASNATVQARVNFGNSAGTDRRIGLALRRDDSNNMIEGLLYRTGGNVHIVRRDAGAATILADVGGLGFADSTDYWLRVVMRGSRIELLTSTNGTTFVSRAVVTETLYASNTGMRLLLTDDVSSPTAQADDLLVWGSP